MLRLAIVLSTLVLVAQSEAGQNYRRYVNERFGTSADIPAGWRAGPSPENGDGLRFATQRCLPDDGSRYQDLRP